VPLGVKDTLVALVVWLAGVSLLGFVWWLFKGRVPTGPVALTFPSEAERARCLETLAGMRRQLDDASGLLRGRGFGPELSYEEWAAPYHQALGSITAPLPTLPALAERRMRTALDRLGPKGTGDSYPDLAWFEKRLTKLRQVVDGLVRDAR
jgi:hypothetical protein